MAGKLYPSIMRGLTRSARQLCVTIAPNSTANPVLTVQASQGIKSVVHTGLGAFTINFQDSYKALIEAQATVQSLTVPLVIQFGVINVTGAGSAAKSASFTVFNPQSGLAVDLPAASTNNYLLSFYMQND